MTTTVYVLLILGTSIAVLRLLSLTKSQFNWKEAETRAAAGTFGMLVLAFLLTFLPTMFASSLHGFLGVLAIILAAFILIAALVRMFAMDLPDGDIWDKVHCGIWGLNNPRFAPIRKYQWGLTGAFVVLMTAFWLSQSPEDASQQTAAVQVQAPTTSTSHAAPSSASSMTSPATSSQSSASSTTTTTSATPAPTNCGAPALLTVSADRLKEDNIPAGMFQCVNNEWTPWTEVGAKIKVTQTATEGAYQYYQFQYNDRTVLLRGPLPKR